MPLPAAFPELTPLPLCPVLVPLPLVARAISAGPRRFAPTRVYV